MVVKYLSTYVDKSKINVDWFVKTAFYAENTRRVKH